MHLHFDVGYFEGKIIDIKKKPLLLTGAFRIWRKR